MMNTKVRRIGNDLSLYDELVNHMSKRYLLGNIAIISDNPAMCMKLTRRKWLEYATHEMRSSTDDLSLYAQNLTFDIQRAYEDVVAHILFSTPDNFKLRPPNCSTLYVTCNVSRQDMYMITSWMPAQSKVVLYV